MYYKVQYRSTKYYFQSTKQYWYHPRRLRPENWMLRTYCYCKSRLLFLLATAMDKSSCIGSFFRTKLSQIKILPYVIHCYHIYRNKSIFQNMHLNQVLWNNWISPKQFRPGLGHRGFWNVNARVLLSWQPKHVATRPQSIAATRSGKHLAPAHIQVTSSSTEVTTNSVVATQHIQITV